MPSFLQEAILHTLIYSDIFDYPLTKDEIWKGLIKCNNVTMQECKNETQKLKTIKFKRGFYFLKGRDKLVSIRKERKKYSAEKLYKAYEIINKIKLIPSVKLIGTTGALAMENGKKEDDIDLFIIATAGLLWTTRLLVTLLVEITGMRRHPQEKNANNKICLNMFVDEDNLAVPKKEQDLFSAHEVVQMKPLFVRGNTYQKFLQENNWVEKYLPNAYKKLALVESDKDTSEVAKQRFRLLGWWRNQVNKITDFFLKIIQLWYMRNRRTTEVIKEGVIRFHPQDARIWIMERYSSKINTYAKQ